MLFLKLVFYFVIFKSRKLRRDFREDDKFKLKEKWSPSANDLKVLNE